MTTDIELSFMARSADAVNDLKPLLERFEAEKRINVHLTVLKWETGWSELVKYALYGQGPDVSEIGSTWVASLAAMSALRPFDRPSLATVGQPSLFLPASWNSVSLADEDEIWAIPWLSNVRFIYYRTDLLEQAGVDPQTAFTTPENLENTLRRLQTLNGISPIVLPTHNSINTLHTVAIWVWGADGNFVNAEGTKTLFNKAEARRGIQSYYNLYKYMSPEARGLDTIQADELFYQGRAAVIVSDPGLLHPLRHNAPDIAAKVATALPPGVPFVGGSNLVVWKSSRHQREALELIKFLVSTKMQMAFSQQVRSLPVRLETLNNPPFSDDPLYQPMVEGLKIGRSYRVRRLWGLVEEKMVTCLNQIWADVFADPNPDLNTLLDQHLEPLAKRLDLALAGGR